MPKKSNEKPQTPVTYAMRPRASYLAHPLSDSDKNMKRSGSPLASSSSLPPPKKLASLFNKPVASASASGSVASASGSTMHKAPRLGIQGLPGGAFQGVWGDWKGSERIAGESRAA